MPGTLRIRVAGRCRLRNGRGRRWGCWGRAQLDDVAFIVVVEVPLGYRRFYLLDVVQRVEARVIVRIFAHPVVVILHQTVLAEDAWPFETYVERFDRRGNEPFELFRSEFGQNSLTANSVKNVR